MNLTGLIWPDLAVEECRSSVAIILPHRHGRSSRLCVEARYRARREVQRRLRPMGCSAEQRQRLDVLTQRRAETSQSWLYLAAPDAGGDGACRAASRLIASTCSRRWIRPSITTGFVASGIGRSQVSQL